MTAVFGILGIVLIGALLIWRAYRAGKAVERGNEAKEALDKHGQINEFRKKVEQDEKERLGGANSDRAGFWLRGRRDGR